MTATMPRRSVQRLASSASARLSSRARGPSVDSTESERFSLTENSAIDAFPGPVGRQQRDPQLVGVRDRRSSPGTAAACGFAR